jgi:hypothetical protein
MDSASPESDPLPSQTITERFSSLEGGDQLTVNNHDRTYEVVDTDTYSVIAEDQDGQRVTFSQNLQTGGWSINEEISYVETKSK